MDKKQKKNKKGSKKKWITITAIGAAVILSAAFLLPQVFRGNARAADVATMTATVTKGTIETTVVGSGNLAADNSISIDLPSGVTVKTVLVEAGDTVAAGDTLATLNALSLQNAIENIESEIDDLDDEIDDASDDTESAEYLALAAEREEYAETLALLQKYAVTNSIVTETAGTIGAVNVSASGSSSSSSANAQESGATAVKSISNTALSDSVASVTLLSSSLVETGATLLADTTVNTATEITGATEIFINNPVTGNTPQSTVMPGVGYTGKITWEPITTKFEGGTQYAANVSLTAQSGYHFAADATVSVTGAQIENLMVSSEHTGNTLSFRAVFPATAAVQQQQQQTQEQQAAPSQAADTSTQAQSGGSAQTPSASSNGGSVSSGSSAATATSSTSTAATETSDSLTSTAFTILVGDANSLTVSVDELDILSVALDQKATVVLDALPDDTFHGTITKISSSGTAQTGVTTYPVTLTLTDADGTGIKAGMNATATISIATSEDVLLIPLDALQEMGNEQFVMIAGDSADGGMGERRTVETGLSDGTNVEITSGLSEGEQITYTESTSTTEESSQSQMPGGMGGVMSGGERPEGMQGGPSGSGGAPTNQ